MGKMAPKWVKVRYGPISLSFFSLLISGGGRNLYFSLFLAISGRRPEMGSVPGKQDRKTWAETHSHCTSAGPFRQH